LDDFGYWQKGSCSHLRTPKAPENNYPAQLKTGEIMKNLFVLTSIFLGSSLLATNVRDFHRAKTYKRVDIIPNGPIGSVSIVIDKSDYELSVYDDKGWYATYPVVFGNNALGDKKMQGDKNTPEGTFRITVKRVHEKWCRFMAIDYPNRESYEKFNQRKQRGEIPANANIGGDIGIHGTWPHEDFVVDRYKNWTLGCISMKNIDVKELYSFTNSGTKVTIRK
jgi:murein L,D-transpeptidase YafK